MTNENYAAPESSLNSGGDNNNDLLTPLLQSRMWVRICSIMGFIATAFMVIAAVLMMVGFSGMFAAMGNSANAGAGMGMGIGMGLFYMLFAVISFFLSLFLHKYAGAITQAERSRSNPDIVKALNYQKSFWKLAGILALIYLVIFGITFIFGILGGIFAASMG